VVTVEGWIRGGRVVFPPLDTTRPITATNPHCEHTEKNSIVTRLSLLQPVEVPASSGPKSPARAAEIDAEIDKANATKVEIISICHVPLLVLTINSWRFKNDPN
jgi:hypothetical protein